MGGSDASSRLNMRYRGQYILMWPRISIQGMDEDKRRSSKGGGGGLYSDQVRWAGE